MAKGKGKKGASAGGPHKKHGPKRHLHHQFSKCIRMQIAKSGLLSKYHDFESWQLAVAARGKRSASYSEFQQFVVLPMDKKKEYFETLKR